MKLVGFNFSKMNLEKITDNLKGLKITTGINILGINEVKSDIFSSLEALVAIKFEYSVNYEPNIAFLKFQGSLIFSISYEESKEILNSWKDKKIPENIRLKIFNIIFRKSSLKALQFEEDFNLPPHILLPSFKSKEKKS